MEAYLLSALDRMRNCPARGGSTTRISLNLLACLPTYHQVTYRAYTELIQGKKEAEAEDAESADEEEAVGEGGDGEMDSTFKVPTYPCTHSTTRIHLDLPAYPPTYLPTNLPAFQG